MKVMYVKILSNNLHPFEYLILTKHISKCGVTEFRFWLQCFEICSITIL